LEEQQKLDEADLFLEGEPIAYVFAVYTCQLAG